MSLRRDAAAIAGHRTKMACSAARAAEGAEDIPKIQSIQDKRRDLERENAAAREEMRKLKEDVKQKRGAYPFSVGQTSKIIKELK